MKAVRSGDFEARGLCATILVTALLIAARTAAVAAEPSIPPPQGFVSDFAGVIDAPTKRYLDGMIRDLKMKTGAEIAVVTVDSTQPLSAFDYAMKIAESWKPGAKGKDNGVVFLIAVRDRDLFILTGYGIEGALPDGKVGEIRDRAVVPRFKQGDYSGGIRAGTEALAAVIAAEYNVKLSVAPPSQRQAPPSAVPLVPLIFAIIFIVLLFRSGLWPLLFLPRGRNHWGGSFGGGGFGGSSGGFGGGGGGFGGFGGGDFGGGGAGGRW